MHNSYLPGTILKIKAQDFVSFNRVSFRPSHLVNILLAPNGAGKSSLISAIVLCLGGKPNIIGKSNQISDYIMYGKSEARLRVDLFDPEDPNEVLSVKRLIKKNGTSIWYLNKDKVTHKEVDEAMKRFNIQVDSLCQVLPQERVQDFSKMNSLQLLENVQKVIDGDLIVNYAKLLELRKSLNTFKEKIETMTVLEQDEISKYNRLEKEVEAIREKKKVLKSVTACRQKLLWIQFNEKKQEQDKVAGYLFDIKKKLNDFDKEFEPLKKEIGVLEKKCATLFQTVKNKKAGVNGLKDKIRKVINQIKMSQDQIENIKESRRRRLLDVDDLQSQIEKADRKMQELSQELDKEKGQELTASVNNFDRCIKEKMKSFQTIFEQENQIKQERVVISNALRLLENKLERCNSINKKRLTLVSNNNPDVNKSHTWVNQNRHQFESNVYGPILLELSISISEGAKYVEFILPFRDLISFVTEKARDTSHLLRMLKDKERLAVNCAHCEPPDRDLQLLYPPLVPLNDIRNLGFNCYLIELIEAPPTVLKHLCKLFRVHLIPVAFNPNKVNRNAISQYRDIKMYFIGDEMYKVSTSKYSKSTSTIAYKVRPARLLADSVDKELIRQTKLEIVSKRETLGDLEGDMVSLVETKTNLQTELNDLRNQKKSCAQRLESFKSTTVRLRRVQEDRMHLLNSLNEGKKVDNNSDNKIRSIEKESKSRFSEICTLTKNYCEELVACTLFEHNLEAAKQLRDSKKDLLSQHEQGKNKLKSDYDELKKSLAEVSAEASNLLTKAKESTDGLEMGDPKFAKQFKAFKNLPDDVDSLKDKINSFDARARCLDNPLQEQYLVEYETAKQSAETLRVDLEKMKEEQNLADQNFNLVFTKWLPQIDSLVVKLNQNFSDFFRKMSCVGDVRLNKGDIQDAVEKFGLEIRVKFRNDSELQVLDQYVQSGGERALTTAVFLLSLQRLSHLPFRCVDEINQGMDKFNERRVYNLLFNTIVDTPSQYFLLTPKFLSNVEYPRICTIQYVFSCPIIKMPNSISASSKQSQVLSDLDTNTSQSSIITEDNVICKNEFSQKNSHRVKRVRIN